MNRSPRFTLLLLLAAASLVPVATWAHDPALHTAPAAGAREFALESLSVPDVSVVDHRGARGGIRSRLAGRGTLLISFTYTGCETLCPITNAILAQVDARLRDVDHRPLHIVTLSLDPERDTPEALSGMAGSLGASEGWTWLTATPADNRRLLESLGADVVTLESHDPMFLIGNLTDGRFVRVVGMPEPARLIAIARSFEAPRDSL